MVGLLGLGVYKGNVSGDVGLAKRLWGIGALGLFLTLAADVAPSVAGPLAFLVLIGYATDGGDKAIQNFLGKVSGAGPTGVAVTPHPTPPGVTVTPPASPGANP